MLRHAPPAQPRAQPFSSPTGRDRERAAWLAGSRSLSNSVVGLRSERTLPYRATGASALAICA